MSVILQLHKRIWCPPTMRACVCLCLCACSLGTGVCDFDVSEIYCPSVARWCKRSRAHTLACPCTQPSQESTVIVGLHWWTKSCFSQREKRETGLGRFVETYIEASVMCRLMEHLQNAVNYELHRQITLHLICFFVVNNQNISAGWQISSVACWSYQPALMSIIKTVVNHVQILGFAFGLYAQTYTACLSIKLFFLLVQ